MKNYVYEVLAAAEAPNRGYESRVNANLGMQKVVYLIGGMSDPQGKSAERINNLTDRLWRLRTEKEKENIRVILHQYNHASARQKLLSTKVPSSSCAIPWWSTKNPTEYTTELLAQIGALGLDPTNQDELYVVAYSAGSALFLDCLGTALGEAEQHAWLYCLKHTVHIAGMTLGWEFNSEMPKWWLVIGPWARVVPWTKNHLTALHFCRGSQFITEMRIKNAKSRNEGKRVLETMPKETYLLGTKDKVLSPADAIEPGFDSTSTQYFEIKGCGHDEILDGAEVPAYIAAAWRQETQKSMQGLTQIKADYLDDYLDPLDNGRPERDDKVKHAIIILHGIRDNGYWAKRIGHRIKEAWRKENTSTEMRTITLSYGYFSLWDFVRPGGREQAVRWFRNAYADIVSLYPQASISFLGHSNGTYLGTEAIKCSAIKFRLMYLAGSVVRRDFWRVNHKDLANVSMVINVRALHDGIVALLPGGFESYGRVGRWMNLGGAGAYGFFMPNPYQPKIREIVLHGGHGAGINEILWEKLAAYVCEVHREEDVKKITQKHRDIDLSPGEINSSAWRFNKTLWFLKFVTGMAIPLAFAVYCLPLLAAIILGMEWLPKSVGSFNLYDAAYLRMAFLILISAMARAVLTRY